MSLAQRVAVGGVLIALTSCLHPNHSLEGAVCAGSEECGAGLTCVAGRCVATTGARVNLLPNGNFEADASGWSPNSSVVLERSEPGHSGQWSLRVAADPSSSGSYLGASVLKEQISPFSVGDLLCSEAWIQRGNVVGSGMTLTMRRYASSGTEQSERGPTQKPADDAWLRITSHLLVVEGYSFNVNLGIHTTWSQMSYFLVDDVVVWKDDGSGCSSAP